MSPDCLRAGAPAMVTTAGRCRPRAARCRAVPSRRCPEPRGSVAEGEPVDVHEVGRLAAGEGQEDRVHAGDRADVGRDRAPALPAAGVARSRSCRSARCDRLSSRTSTSPLTPAAAPEATRAMNWCAAVLPKSTFVVRRPVAVGDEADVLAAAGVGGRSRAACRSGVSNDSAWIVPYAPGPAGRRRGRRRRRRRRGAAAGRVDRDVVDEHRHAGAGRRGRAAAERGREAAAHGHVEDHEVAVVGGVGPGRGVDLVRVER